MKLKKKTKQPAATKKRWYEDACGTAFALELIGERWSVLIMRELMFGPRRFTELRHDLPGISANILTRRLAGLETRGIVSRRLLPPPASAQVYELTDWGLEAEPLIQGLGRWATRHPDHDPTLPLSAASLLMSFRTMFDPARVDGDLALGLGLGLGLRPDARPFVAQVRGGKLTIAQREFTAAEVDAVVNAEVSALAAFVYGGASMATLEADGRLSVKGKRKALARFSGLFVLPQKIDRPVACP